MTPEEIFLTNIGKVKHDKGVSDRWVAEQMYMDRSSVSYMMSGKTKMTLNRACQLCEVFGVRLTDMIAGGEIV